MGWWPFSRSKSSAEPSSSQLDNLHIKGTKVWIEELQQACERNYNSPTSGHMLIREMQIEWSDAHQDGDIGEELFEGLERRSFHLLRAQGKDWINLLDNLEFWKPGWRAEGERSDED